MDANNIRKFGMILTILNDNVTRRKLSEDMVLKLFDAANRIVMLESGMYLTDENSVYGFINSVGNTDFVNFYTKEQMTYIQPDLKAIIKVMRSDIGIEANRIMEEILAGKTSVSCREAIIVNNFLEQLEEIDRNIVREAKHCNQAAMVVCREHPVFRF